MSIWVMTSRGLVGVFGVGLCPLAVWLAACGSADDRSRYGSGGSGGTTAGMSGGSANAGGSNVICKPSPIDDWTPTWTPPLAPTPGVCTAAQIDALTNACVAPDTSTLVSCRAFNADQNNAACLSCVLTPATSPAYGAASQDSYGFLSANEGGCIAEADGDLSADGCGAKNQAYNECLLAACEKNCWTGQNAGTIQACQDAATEGECASYYAAAACGRSLKYSSCTFYIDFASAFSAMANLFCGAGPELGAGGASSDSNAGGAAN